MAGVKKATQPKTKSMSVETFIERFNGGGYDVEELASIASDVEGEVGEKARALVTALSEFDDALESIDFEVG